MAHKDTYSPFYIWIFAVSHFLSTPLIFNQFPWISLLLELQMFDWTVWFATKSCLPSSSSLSSLWHHTIATGVNLHNHCLRVETDTRTCFPSIHHMEKLQDKFSIPAWLWWCLVSCWWGFFAGEGKYNKELQLFFCKINYTSWQFTSVKWGLA